MSDAPTRSDATPAMAPVGAIALVFTDIQGSTKLWERRPDQMRRALDQHNAALRRAIVARNGYEVKTEGDAFIVAFRSTRDAVQWCLDVQRQLVDEPWEAQLLDDELGKEELAADGRVLRRGIRVRMGVHAGEPECVPDPVTGRMDYFGPVVNRAARIGSAGHGGQILLSHRVWKEIQADLAALGDPLLTDLGEHRLKDLESAERLFQALPRSLEGRTFPPLKTVDVRKTNLSPHPTPFVGRAADLEALHAIVQGGARLVTLMGPGGTGKTRLSTRYAAIHLDDYARDGGVWFCDLTEARSLDGICIAIGAALNIPLTGGKSSGDTVNQIGTALAGRGRAMLVLDNFEQVVEHAAATVGRWMQLAAEARFLVSSQERLRIPGETAYELKPLGSQGDGGNPLESEAAQLFLQRAREVRKGYAPSAADAAAIAEIVKQLDGIPLAIELAAARMGVLSPQKLLERLPRRFDLLGGARRDVTARQATLRGAIDWSWNLLQPFEQDALAQCSVFHGGFSLEAAEEVIDLSAHDGAPWPLDVVQSLRDKSLLRAWEPAEFPDELRFGMYSNIREYAAEKLRSSGKESAALDRHGAYYLRVAGEWAEGVDAHGGVERLRRLATELENLFAIFQRETGAGGAIERALRAILVLDPVLSTRGPFELHLKILDTALARTEGAEVDPLLLARVLEARGRARRIRGRATEARADFDRGILLARAGREVGLEAQFHAQIAFSSYQQGRFDEARGELSRSLDLARAAGDRRVEALACGYLGAVEASAGGEARKHYERALAIHRERGNLRFEGVALNNLGILHRQQARFEEARACYERAREIYREIGDRAFEGSVVGSLGGILLEEGRYAEARQHSEEAIRILLDVGNLRSSGFFRANIGLIDHLEGRPSEACDAYEKAVAVFRGVGDPRFEGLYLGFLGAAKAACGYVDDAARDLTSARARLDPQRDKAELTALEVLEGLIFLARSKEGPDAEGLRARASCLLGSDSDARRIAEISRQSDDVRIALRLLENTLRSA